MPALNQRFSLADQREVFFSSAYTSAAIRRVLRQGRVRELGPRLYTKNLDAAPEEIVLRNWAEIAAGYFPDSVVVGRTALAWRPAADGSVFIAAQRVRDVRLPGLWLRPQRGPAHAPGDQKLYGHNIYMSSRPRAFLENVQPSRSRNGAVSRTVNRHELEEELETYGRLNPTSLNQLRDDARELAPSLGMEKELKVLDALIGTLLGTQNVKLSSARAQATASGTPYDPHRIQLFEQLAAALLGAALPQVTESPGHELSVFGFFESYFSNYIEGTEFTVEEAENIVFRGAVPSQRPKDAHDILGTYQLVTDRHQRARVPASAADLLEILTSQHKAMLSQRPDIGPGEFKQRNNHVGGREFVDRRLVEGTLREAYRVYDTLPAGFARAAFAMFLVSEAHPFADGNGRTARLLMNSELSAVGQQRIIVTTRDRGDYLAGLRGVSVNDNFSSYITILTGLQSSSVSVDFSQLETAEADLDAQKAFVDADDPTNGVGGILALAESPQGT
jgi:hypothetical protein